MELQCKRTTHLKAPTARRAVKNKYVTFNKIVYKYTDLYDFLYFSKVRFLLYKVIRFAEATLLTLFSKGLN